MAFGRGKAGERLLSAQPTLTSRKVRLQKRLLVESQLWANAAGSSTLLPPQQVPTCLFPPKRTYTPSERRQNYDPHCNHSEDSTEKSLQENHHLPLFCAH